jgi:signal transduction histidine kinase
MRSEQAISPVDVIEQVIGISGMLRSGLRSSIEIAFINQLPNPSPSIVIDSLDLHQALTNLIINARDAISATPQNKGQIIIRSYSNEFNTAQSTLCRACDEKIQGAYITISVSDTGIGMTTAQMTHLFKPLHGFKNAGLVIPMISEILHHHHAHLTIESTLGKGTVFYLHFPAAEAKKANALFQ